MAGTAVWRRFSWSGAAREWVGTIPFLPVIPLSLLLAACGDSSEAAPDPVELPVVVVDDKPQPLLLTYTARTQGERQVEVRARVSGILQRRYYREGEAVREGDRLFLIDPAPFAAEVRSAQGRLGVEQARLNAATRHWHRVEKLAERGFASGRSRDDAEAEYRASMASVAAARAELARAQLDLGYTSVRAPIGGITGREARSEGSLVDAAGESALLTTITQADRLQIHFAMPDEEARLVRAALQDDPGNVRVRLVPENGGVLADTAGIDFISTTVNPNTGTVDARATFDNGAGALSAGQFIRAEITGITSRSGAYVPARAVMHGAEGPFVWIIDQKGGAQMRPVTLGLGNGNLMHIAKGLRRGDRVIVDGVLKLQPGTPVKPEQPPQQPKAKPAQPPAPTQ